MSSLDKLRELRDQLCQKQIVSTATLSSSNDVIFDQLVCLHTEMLVDTSVSEKYTEKIFELINTLKEIRSKSLGVGDV